MSEWKMTPAVKWLERYNKHITAIPGWQVYNALRSTEDWVLGLHHPCLTSSAAHPACMHGEWRYSTREVDEEYWLSDGGFVDPETATQIRERRAKDRLKAESLETL